MAQKLVPETYALARTLDKSWDIRHDKGFTLTHADNSEHRSYGGEMVIRDYRLCLADNGDKG